MLNLLDSNLVVHQSISDDSVELGSAENQSYTKISAEKTAPKPAASWWQDDEDSGGTGRGNDEPRILYYSGHVSLWLFS